MFKVNYKDTRTTSMHLKGNKGRQMLNLLWYLQSLQLLKNALNHHCHQVTCTGPFSIFDVPLQPDGEETMLIEKQS